MSERNHGFFSAIAAFALWGALPLFWKQLDGMPPLTIVCHRTLGGLLLLSGVLWLRRQGHFVWSALRTPRLLGWHFLSGSLLASNWLLYLWATLHGRILEGALGYYLNPFFNILFGFLWFGERQNRVQLIAIGLALAGVAVQTSALAGFPWVSVTLAISFSLYAVMQKRTPLPSIPGVSVETILMAPCAMVWLITHPSDAFPADPSSPAMWFLLATGVATVLPLLFFGHATRTIPLTTLGILQFIGPTIQFLIGWLVYQETMTTLRFASFFLIWLALLVYMADSRSRATPARA